MSNEQLVVDAVRMLSIEAIQRANSGHPGMPMGMADLAVVLWGRFLNVDPDHPEWDDRDRFVLSNGHGSMLLYSMLHLSGFPVSIDDIRNFRQWGYPTAGHPELEPELGIEVTTGPLGQGFGMGVGLAMAEAHLSAKLGAELVNHDTYGFVSDGDLMEGVASEAASLAGHLGLGRLIYLYDDNEISLVGPTDLTFSEDVPKRFDAYGWHTITVDGHDRPAIAEAIVAAKAELDRPTLISAKTHIGYGSSKQDTAAAHGSPLGDEEIERVRARFGWSHPPFEVPDEAYAFMSAAMERGRSRQAEWAGRMAGADAATVSLYKSHFKPGSTAVDVPDYEAGTKVATRKIGGTVLNAVAATRPDLIGGSADLASSTNTLITDSGDFSKTDHASRNIRFGVREHGMGSIVNGLTVHGGLRAFGATFFQFSDYMRGAVRLGALMGVPSIWVFTHDSVFLAEDGPTHQPIAHMAAMRAIPNVWVMRPATPAEVAGAWEVAMARTGGPTALVLTRQGLPVPADAGNVPVAKGGYVVADGTDAVLIATGSELSLALAARDRLADRGTSLRVVSMPCVEAFHEQDATYRSAVLGDGLPIASIEAAVTFGWGDITGAGSLNIGIDHFGASAPADVLAAQYGFTPDAVADRVAEWLAAR
ncbi:MAG: transketolase [bacterium]|nr:transketolase [bacterium]